MTDDQTNNTSQIKEKIVDKSSSRVILTFLGVVAIVFIVGTLTNTFSNTDEDAKEIERAKVESFRDSFTYSCKKTASEKYCSCFLSAVESNYTEKEMAAEAKLISETNKMSDKFKDLATTCLK